MHVAIVGNGIAGVTAARHLRKLDSSVRITLISGETDHHWSRPALMYVYMGHMRWEDVKPYEDHFWPRNRIDLVRRWVTSIDVEGRQLHLDGARTIPFDKLLLAVGSKPNKFGWPGQDLRGVSGMVSLQDLQAIEAASVGLKHAAIVGGGLIGVELAEMFHTRGIDVTFLVREHAYWNHVLPAEEGDIVGEVIRAEGIDLRLETELTEIVDDGTGQVGAIVDSKGDRVEVGFVGLTAGVRPNLTVCAGSPIATDRGILVDRTLVTNVEGIYAAGDCAQVKTPEGHRDLIQAVWYTGRMMGEVAARNLLGASDEYDSGTWFNSAKFFDLEYQVYGYVPSAMAHHQLPSLAWISPDRRHACRLVETEDGKLSGISVLGIRMRHRVCERWIEEGRDLAYVLAHLREAMFDPEFYRRWDRDIVAALSGKVAA
ncbi:MAG: FAD-dependent oxidoreductase [Proteobacteria bacterium]|nr:FAD-dependent oxidoreductase [Pseudomonadota bacterium]